MVLKYKFNLKDIKLEDFKVYLLAMFKAILPKKKIKNLNDLQEFIQKKSAWVSQVTLYGYLKTRMGTKYVLHFDDEKFLDNDFGKENLLLDSFIEIAPLDYVIDNSNRKELSSVPISDVVLPNIVYMIVDKKIELEIKLLKDYPEWEFLPTDDLNRKTIEIYLDLKIAKRFCNKEQKVIKVPNSNIFKIVAPILISRGISRIVSSDKLISI